tara:strand:- start:836 stop:1387 length:552 start_codon:yes stop_codon:yes gene_type:complete
MSIYLKKRKIGITGHTRGIGKKLYDKLSPKNLCTGFSRNNGYDISKDYNLIIEKLKFCDVFINNAYHGKSQVKLLNKIFNFWKEDKNKIIVNISSLSKYLLEKPPNEYSMNKSRLNEKAFELMFKSSRKCKIININPGPVNTKMSAHKNVKKLSADECSDIIIWTLNQPKHIEIGEIGFWRLF